MKNSERRYDIDWLRVIAIGLLLIYHVAIVFQPWALFIGFPQSNGSLESLWIPMSMLNVWRIPLLFFVSGMGVYFAMRKRNWKQLVIERGRRILIPFLFGMLAIVPLHVFIWQAFYHQELHYVTNMGHLWFLGNIFAYVLVLLPLFYYLKKKGKGRFFLFLQKVWRHPLGLLTITVFFVIEAVVVQPDLYTLYAYTGHGFFMGFLAFLAGFLSMYCGEAFRQNVVKWRWAYLVSGVILFGIRWMFFELKTPDYLMAVESNIWTFAVFGFGFRWLNKPGKVLGYLSQSAYPVYIVHMACLYAGGYLILPMDISLWVKFILVVLFTFAGSMMVYELLIRRLGILRVLFGLKMIRKVDNKANVRIQEPGLVAD